MSSIHARQANRRADVLEACDSSQPGVEDASRLGLNHESKEGCVAHMTRGCAVMLSAAPVLSAALGLTFG